MRSDERSVDSAAIRLNESSVPGTSIKSVASGSVSGCSSLSTPGLPSPAACNAAKAALACSASPCDRAATAIRRRSSAAVPESSGPIEASAAKYASTAAGSP